ncbi:MAG: alpha/beta hydrolase [Pseudomonadota bacterium]
MKRLIVLLVGLLVLAWAGLALLAQERTAPQVAIPDDALVVLDNPQFSQPVGWQWQRLSVGSSEVRWGFASPDAPQAVVLFLHGYSAPIEIYYESLTRLMNAGFAVAAMDWPGQGGSSRGSASAQKIHATTLDGHVDAARAVSAEVRQQFSDLPMLLSGLSLGAHLGTRLLATEPGLYQAAALVTPAYDLYPGRPSDAEKALIGLLDAVGFGERYLPGQTDFVFDLDAHNGVASDCSHPNERTKLWYASMLRDPTIRVGSMSNAFMLAMIESGRTAQANQSIDAIDIPVWMPLAENDWFVDNAVSSDVCQRLAQCKSIQYPEARHCLFEEADAYYEPFIADWITFLQTAIGVTSSAALSE